MDGKPAVMLEILKTDEEDTSTIARQVRRYVEQRSASLPSGLNMVAWADASRNVDDMMEMLIWNGLQGFGLVVLTLMLFFNLRLSFWVAMGLPVAFGGAFIVMGAYGMSANLITLFGLILVSGMIDDDAIVIAEQIHIRATELGEKPALAAIEGTSAVAMPVLAGVATTITAFVPLLFVSGVMGKFIRALPIVVIAAMVASTVESLTAMPAHLRHGERVGEGWAASAWFAPIRWLRQQADTALQALIRGPYRSFYRAALDYRFATVGIGLMMALITAGWVWGGHTPFILMGKVDAGTLRARVRFPEGTPASTTEAALNRIEAAANALSNDPGIQRSSSGQLVRHIFSQLGQWTQFVTHSGSHLGEVTLELMPAQERNLHSAVITQRWQKLIGIIQRTGGIKVCKLEGVIHDTQIIGLAIIEF